MALGRRRGAVLVAAAMCALLTGAGTLGAETKLLGPDDWQYRELDALARAGLLSGHPAGALATWTDRLSRYEAASLALRAVAGVGAAYQAQGAALRRAAQAEGETGGAGAQPARPVSGEDLARVEKLIEEFRAELVTMGTNVDDLSAALKEAQQRLTKVEAEQRKHKIDGYMQLRYRDDDATSGKQEFLVRRARVNLRGPVSERTSYRVEFQLDAKDVYEQDERERAKGPGSKTQVRTAYVDYQLSPRSTLRAGQAKIPWGYELLESVPNLWTAERALFMDRLFPNQRDIGVQVSYQRSAAAPQFDVGVFNGTGINASDNNDRKNLMARVNFPVPNGTVALSGYVGEDGTGAGATDQDRNGVSARLRWGGLQFLGELAEGKDRGSDVRGWYAQLGHPVGEGKPNLVFVKYDTYDEDRDRADDLFRRWSLGYWWDLDSATRMTLVWEKRQVGEQFSQLSKWDGDAAYLQLQVRY